MKRILLSIALILCLSTSLWAGPSINGGGGGAAGEGTGDFLADGTVPMTAGIQFEGTANDFETTLTVTDPTADRTATLPNATGNLQVVATNSTTAGQVLVATATAGVAEYTSTLTAQLGDDAAQFKGSTAGHIGYFHINMAGSTTDAVRTIVSSQSANRSNTIPDMDGAFVITGGPIAFDESVEPATDNLTAAQLSRGFVNNYGQSGAAILTLPAAAEGLSFVAIVGTKYAGDWEFHHNGAETIYTDIGGTLTAGRAGIKCNNQEIGSRMSCSTFQTGAAAYSWLCGAVSGTWTAVAP